MNQKCFSLFSIFLLYCLIAAGSSSAQNLPILGRLAGFTQGTVLSNFIDECARKYGQAAVNTIEHNMDITMKCLQKTIGNYSTTISDLSVVGNIHQFCNFVPAVERCIEPSVVSLKGCTDAAGDRDLDNLNLEIVSILDYLCANGGERIIKFVSLKGPECMAGESGIKIMQCVLKTGPLARQLEQTPSIFHPLNCKVLTEISECFVRSFEQCTNSATLKDIVQGFFDIVIKIDCVESLLRSSSSSIRQHLWWTSFSALALSIITWKFGLTVF